MLRKMRPYLLLTSVTILLFSTLLHADTTWVAGEVYGTWTREGNPYLVTDTLIVPLDSTLNIQPGVQIWFLDQEIRRTPILVFGRLRAIGTEDDSVYFFSPVTGFAGINNNSTHGSEIRLEYCVIDSGYQGIESHYGHVVLTHSRIIARTTPIRCYQQSDTLSCNTIHGGTVLLYYGSAVFQHNVGQDVTLSTYYQQMSPIHDNTIRTLSIDHGNDVEIYDNQLESGSTYATNTHWFDNTVELNVQTRFGVHTIEDNQFGGSILVYDSYATIQENRISGVIDIYDCEATILANLVTSDTRGIAIYGQGVNIIENNTIICDDRGIYLSTSLIPQQILNNIIVGDGVNCTGIYSSSPNASDIRYNDFHNLTIATHNCELDTGNIFLDPCFRAGSPYDYQLQANSPCIDAGDPASPLDPDGTRADMGCYFFDHRIDNPPAIVSPVEVNVQRGTTLRYVARATDDFGPLNFGFWNLPGWLHRVDELIDFEDKTAVVSGRVPQGQGDFAFGVWVEDGSAQRDSQEVDVLVSPYTILAGEVTGVLTRDRSPYMVVEDVVVPSGDSLIIEPGVEIRFQWEPVEDLRHRFVVRGKLDAVGTPEDTIRFLPEFGDSLAWAWRGIQCIGSEIDTSKINFAFLLNPYYGVVADSQSNVMIRHSNIVDSRFGVYIDDNSWALVDSCESLIYHDMPNTFVRVAYSSATVSKTRSEYFDHTSTGSHFDFRHDSQGIVEECTLIDGGYGRAEYNSELQFIRNRIANTNSGVYYINGASGRMANNIFSGGDGAGIYSADTVLVSNNLFFDTNQGAGFSNPPIEVSLRNNLFLSNEIGIEMHYSHPPFEDISYNDFFGNDSDFVNCIPDSTNLYLDPMVQDTIDFRLSFGSPCIDSGDPDPFFNDVDSTRNDIGCWGGPWGESYPYVPVLSYQLKPIPTEFALLPPYPNPFNSVVVIPFTVPAEMGATITIYNILGQKIQEYTFPPLSPGVHRILWNAESCASGLYIVELISGKKELKQKVVLLK